MLARILSKVQDEEGAGAGFKVWTDYSGMGGAELAVDAIIGALPSTGCQLHLECYRSREIRRDGRKVLLATRPPAGATHVFGDILANVPWKIKMRLLKCLRQVNLKLAGLQKKAEEEGSTKPSKEAVMQLGEEFCKQLNDIMGQCNLLRTATSFATGAARSAPSRGPLMW
jgi:hypothetical protein